MILSQNQRIAIPAKSSYRWAKAVIELGENLLSMDNKINLDKRFVTEHFFLIAVMKLHDWSDVLQAVEPNFKYAAKLVFDVTTDEVKSARDMREHDDEYLQGGGRQKSKFMYRTEDFSVDASSTIVNDNGYLIGGRANVGKLVDAAQSFLQAFNDAIVPLGLSWITSP